MKDLKPEDVFAMLQKWGEKHVWSTDTLYQVIILLGAFILGNLTYRFFRSRIEKSIDDSKLPLRIKRSLKHLQKLISPLLMLLIAYPVSQIAGSEIIGLNISFIDGAIKLTAAWIVIRIAVEFIENRIVRNFFAVTIWALAALSIFNVLPETMNALDAFGFDLGTFRISALTIIKGALSLFTLLYVAMFVSTFAERQVLRTKSLTRSSQVLVAKIVRVALITLAIIVAVTSAGIDLSIFAVLSGAIGLGIGFGLQKVVSNLFSGMLLLMDRSIQPGDVIELEDSATFGWVKTMGARYTEIITRDNKSYLIPNEDFVTQRVVNWSHGNDRLVRVSVEFGTSYNCDPHKVIEIALKSVTKPERVVETPTPVCWITEFGDSSVNYTLRFWIKDAEGGVANIKGEVMLCLWDALKENNIEIPFPQRVVHMATA